MLCQHAARMDWLQRCGMAKEACQRKVTALELVNKAKVDSDWGQDFTCFSLLTDLPFFPSLHIFSPPQEGAAKTVIWNSEVLW